MANLGICKPIIHHDDLISINFKFNGYDITFRDSNLLLITSLRIIGKCFGVDIQKSIFPYSFVNENRLNYNSWVPDFKYFDGVSKADYMDYLNSFNLTTWNLKKETIKYCEAWLLIVSVYIKY